MSMRYAISIVVYTSICITYVQGQVTIKQSPEKFIEGENGKIDCRTDIENVEINITRNNDLVCASSDLQNCDYTANRTNDQRGVILTIPTINRVRDEGQWKCVTNNSNSTLQLVVNVPVSTVAIEEKGLNFIDGDTTNIKCKVQPQNAYPQPSITWKIDSEVKSTGLSAEFNYRAVKSDNKKNLECLADNNLGSAKKDTLVMNIKYKPVVSVEPSTSPTKVIEETSLSFKCNADANPSPIAYNWFKAGSTSVLTAKSSTQTFNRIQRSDSGSYFCTVTNEIGNGTKNIIVDILYPPDKFDLRNEYRVIENNPLSVECRVDANPTAHNVTWDKVNNKLIKFSNISRENAGIYTCTATNTMMPTIGSPLTKSGTGTIRINVLYGPEVTVPTESIEVTEFCNLRTSCTVISNPPSTITWLSPGSKVLSGTKNLEINNINRNETGNYTCKATVKFDTFSGSSVTRTMSKTTLVTVLHVPNNPTQPFFVNSSSTTMCVRWKPGFNGGKSQTFIIQYSSDNKTWVDSPQISERNNTTSLSSLSQELNYCLRNLMSDTHYTIRIFPQNVVGKSEYVYFQPTCCIPIKTESEERSSGYVIGLAVGFGLMSLIAFLAILVIISLYRRLKKVPKKGSHYASTELVHRSSGLYEDLRQPPDGGREYENNTSTAKGAENIYENQTASSKKGGAHMDNERKYENIGLDKSDDSGSKDQNMAKMSPYLTDEKNYENFSSVSVNSPNIYENLKRKKKVK